MATSKLLQDEPVYRVAEGIYKDFQFLLKPQNLRSEDERINYLTFMANLMQNCIIKSPKVADVWNFLGRKGIPVSLLPQDVKENIVKATLSVKLQDPNNLPLSSVKSLSECDPIKWPYDEPGVDRNFFYDYHDIKANKEFMRILFRDVIPNSPTLEDAHRLMLDMGLAFTFDESFYEIIKEGLAGTLSEEFISRIFTDGRRSPTPSCPKSPKRKDNPEKEKESDAEGVMEPIGIEESSKSRSHSPDLNELGTKLEESEQSMEDQGSTKKAKKRKQKYSGGRNYQNPIIQIRTQKDAQKQDEDSSKEMQPTSLYEMDNSWVPVPVQNTRDFVPISHKEGRDFEGTEVEKVVQVVQDVTNDPEYINTQPVIWHHEDDKGNRCVVSQAEASAMENMRRGTSNKSYDTLPEGTMAMADEDEISFRTGSIEFINREPASGIFSHLGFLFKNSALRDESEEYMHKVFLARLIKDVKPAGKSLHFVAKTLGGMGVPFKLLSSEVRGEIVMACDNLLAGQNDGDTFVSLYYNLAKHVWPYDKGTAHLKFPCRRDFINFMVKQILPFVTTVAEAHRLMLEVGINFYLPAEYFQIIRELVDRTYIVRQETND